MRYIEALENLLSNYDALNSLPLRKTLPVVNNKVKSSKLSPIPSGYVYRYSQEDEAKLRFEARPSPQ